MIGVFFRGFFLNVLFAAVAAAQTVTVRSGEHSNFTRVVLTLPDRAGWSLNQSGDRAILELENGPYAFDTSSVFQRISGKRLTSVNPTGNDSGLMLALACPCEVSGFWHAETMLVLDIKDKPELPKSRRTSPTDPTATQTTRFGASSNSAAAGLLMSSLPIVSDEAPKGPALKPKVEGVKKTDPLEETRDQLIKQFGRAATQGLLTPRSQIDKTSPSDAAPVSDVIRQGEDLISDPVTREGGPSQIHLQAQTSMDQAFLRQLSNGSLPKYERACLPNDWVNVQAWANDSPVWSQVGALRSGMISAAGKLEIDVVHDLAKLYIHYGFGAEALQTIYMVPNPKPEHRALQAMAQVLEYGASDASSILHGHFHCGPDVLLWSLLATPTWPDRTEIDTDAALLAFTALPYHLRQYLGPDLSRRFRATGGDDIADQVLRATARNPQSASQDFMVERAISEAGKGSRDTAIKTLESVVAAGAEPSATALVKLIDYKLEAKEPISFEMAQLAEAYAKENDGLPISDQLRWAQVIALASSGAFDAAFALMQTLEESISTKRPNLKSDVLGLLVDNSDDMQFLRHALPFGAGEVPPITPVVANGLASRLLELGFPEAARQVTSATVPENLDRNSGVLNAKVALALGQPRKAEVELLGFEGEDVNLLRARARSMAGEHAAAGDLYAAAKQPQAALHEKWLAEDWQSLDGSENPAVSQLASVLSAKAGAEADNSEGAAELAENRRLLETSTAIRESIQAVLQATPTPVSDLE